MAGTDPLTGARLGDMNDGPLGGLYLAGVVNDLAPFTIPSFGTATARNVAFQAWVQAGNTMRKGLHCAVDGVTQRYDGTTWRYLEPVPIANMAARPTANLYPGYAVRPTDRPAVTYAWDGTRWVQQGLLADVSGAPAGSYVSRQEGTRTPTTTNASGAFLVELHFPFSAAPLWTSVLASDNTNGLVDVGTIGDQNASGYISCQGFTAGGAVIGSGKTIRVTYTAVGYNT